MTINTNTPPKMEDREDQLTTDPINPFQRNNNEAINPDFHEADPQEPSEVSLEDSAEKLNNAEKNQIPGANQENLNIAKTSRSRLLNNGKIRFFVYIGGVLALFLGFAVYKVISPSSEEKLTTQNDVAVPRSHAKASALSSPEQAEHMRELQNQKADQADKNGETFVAGFITEADPSKLDPDDQNQLPTQPGASPKEETRMFFDAQGRKYTKDEALALYQSGQNIPGVTHGDGSISDANLNSSVSAVKDGPKSGKIKKGQPDEPAFQTYVVEPYSPKTTGNSSSERSTTSDTQLDTAAQNTEAWATEFLALRQKKSQLIDEKAQLAFEEQVTKLSEQMKQSGQKSKAANYQTITYAKSDNSVSTPETINPKSTTESKDIKKEKVLMYAGQQSRAILKSQVNSDHGLEVMATIVNGPLKNSLVVGTATVSEDNMRFTFTKVLRQGKEEMQISATGREIGTNALGMADQVNKHYIKRVGSLVAAGVLSGVGEAYEQTAGVTSQITGTTVVSTASEPSNKRIAGNVVGEVGDMLSGEFKNGVNRKPTVIADSGKVFNLFFNQNVYDTTNGLPSKN